MIKTMTKWMFRFLGAGVLWVFLLSVTVKDRTLFSYASEILVQNSVVEYVDKELATVWSKVTETMRITYSELSQPKL